MGHDQRFKEFLQIFLQEFLRLFYPHIERRLDFSSVELLDKEVFTERGDGSRRETDVVARLATRSGRPELLLVHIEVQARTRATVKERMFEYYWLLRTRYKLPVFPLAVYLRGGRNAFTVEEYRESLFGSDVLLFRYDALRLSKLRAEQYLERSDPVGAALAALMSWSAGSRRRSRASLKIAMLSSVVESTLGEDGQLVLVDLIETYFPLSDEEKDAYDEIVGRSTRKCKTWS